MKKSKNTCEACGHPIAGHGKKGCDHSYLAGLIQCACEMRFPS